MDNMEDLFAHLNKQLQEGLATFQERIQEWIDNMHLTIQSFRTRITVIESRRDATSFMHLKNSLHPFTILIVPGQDFAQLYTFHSVVKICMFSD